MAMTLRNSVLIAGQYQTALSSSGDTVFSSCLTLLVHRNEQKFSPYEFATFNAGPRLCLGKPMAYLEAKIVASFLWKHFEITPAIGKNEHVNSVCVLTHCVNATDEPETVPAIVLRMKQLPCYIKRRQ